MIKYLKNLFAMPNIFRRLGLAAMLLVAYFGTASPAEAAIPAAKIAVGGLSPYATLEYVEGVYGAPTYQTTLENGEKLYAYGTSTLIYFSTEKRLNDIVRGTDDGDDGLFLVRRIDTRTGSGMSTLDGIGIGDTEQKIVAAYGKPDVRVISVADCDLRLMYVGEAKSDDEGLCFMTFSIKDNKVIKISCYATRH